MTGGKPELERPSPVNAKMNMQLRPQENKDIKKDMKKELGPNNIPESGFNSGGGHGGHSGGSGGGGPAAKRPFGGKQQYQQPRFINDNSGNFSNYNNFQRQRMANVGNNMSIPGPTTNLQTKEGEAKKFIGRCRLFVGNLTPDIDEVEFRKMFEPFGQIAEVFLSAQKGFGFVKMDTRANAEAARNQLDGSQRKGRVLRVRFATHGSSLKVRNLSSWVSNELLEKAFSLFGEVERAVVIVDDRGKPTGDGIVEFARKPGAQMALKRCIEGCFMLTASPKPVIVEPLEQKDDEDGYPEKLLPKNSPHYLKERDIGPRFAQPNSFEFEFGQKWKQLFELEKQKKTSLDTEVLNDRERLDDQMEFAIYEHETNMLREKLRQREQDANNLMREREMRRHERLREDEKRQEMLRYQDKFSMMRNEEMRRRQEDNLMLQQEAALRQMQSGGGGNSGVGGVSGNLGGAGNGNVVGGGTGGPGNSGAAPGGRAGAPGPLGGNAGGPAGPVMSSPMNLGGGGGIGSGNMGGQSGPGGPGSMGGGQMPRQSRFEQPSASAAGMMGPGPASHMNRGMGPMGGGGPQMGGPMGDIRGGGGGGAGGMVRRDMMDRRDHRDDYAEAKRRRF